MTPERLQEIEHRATEFYSEDVTGQAPADAATSDVWELLDYIDLLHEDLRLTREEREAEKHKCLEFRLSIGALGNVLRERDEEIERLTAERDAYRSGRGPAQPQTYPSDIDLRNRYRDPYLTHPTAYHRTDPIPDSKGNHA